jgi:hypothetical protein
VPLLKELRRRIDDCLAEYQLKASSILHDLPMKVGVQLKKQEHISIRSISDAVKEDISHKRETDALTDMGHQFGTFLPQLYTSSEALLQTLLNENLQGRIRRYDSQALSKLGKLIQGLRERGICLQYLADQQHRLEREYNDWDHAVTGVELQLQRLRKTLEDHSEQIRILQHNLVETWHHLRWKEVGDWKECIFDKETKFSTDSSNMDLLFLANLFDLPYWSRLWIVQEVLLAKKIVLCFSDDARTTQDWEILTAARKSVEGIPAAWEMDTTIAILTSLARECLPFRLDRQRECRDQGWSFQSLVMMTEKLLCQDPRDKIYGLLGLVQTNDQVEFDINYAKPMHDLY